LLADSLPEKSAQLLRTSGSAAHRLSESTIIVALSTSSLHFPSGPTHETAGSLLPFTSVSLYVPEISMGESEPPALKVAAHNIRKTINFLNLNFMTFRIKCDQYKMKHRPNFWIRYLSEPLLDREIGDFSGAACY
jgi:hypothetical protein